MGFLRVAALKFINPELFCQEEDSVVEAIQREAYDVHQIKLRHAKNVKNARKCS